MRLDLLSIPQSGEKIVDLSCDPEGASDGSRLAIHQNISSSECLSLCVLRAFVYRVFAIHCMRCIGFPLRVSASYLLYPFWHLFVCFLFFFPFFLSFLKKNQNAPRPSEHPPVRKEIVENL